MTLNEIRKAENMNYIEGLDVINVGLGAVLYNIETHEYYTPNTDTMANTNIDLAENVRYNKNHGKDGRFATGSSKHGKSYKNTKSVYTPRISKSEYNRVSHGIATDFPKLKADGKIRLYEYGNYHYRFKVIEFGTYEFIAKIKLK